MLSHFFMLHKDTLSPDEKCLQNLWELLLLKLPKGVEISTSQELSYAVSLDPSRQNNPTLKTIAHLNRAMLAIESMYNAKDNSSDAKRAFEEIINPEIQKSVLYVLKLARLEHASGPFQKFLLNLLSDRDSDKNGFITDKKQELEQLKYLLELSDEISVTPRDPFSVAAESLQILGLNLCVFKSSYRLR
jgi:hypothetical protein